MTEKIIYIGSNFYMESGTRMSCIYTEAGDRSDWGHVEELLRRGKTVEIRPATQAERFPYEEKLRQINSSHI